MARYKSQALQAPERPQQRYTAEHKKRLFIGYYFKEANGAKAAALAGHQGVLSSLATQANQYLKDPYVKAELDRRRRLAEERTDVSVEKLLKELGKIAFANMDDYVQIDEQGDPHIDLSNLSPEQWAAIEEVITETYMDGAGPKAREVKRVKIKLHNKIAAIEKAGKHLGMFDRRRSGDADDPGDDAQQISYTLNIGGNAAIQFKGKSGMQEIEDRQAVLIEADAEED